MAWKLGISTKSGTEAAIDVCDYFTDEESSGSGFSGKMVLIIHCGRFVTL